MKRSCFLLISIILIILFGNNTFSIGQTCDLNPRNAIITNNTTVDIQGIITVPGSTNNAGNSAALYLTDANFPYPRNDPRQNQIAIIVADLFSQADTTYTFNTVVHGNQLPIGTYKFCYRFTINGISYLGGYNGGPEYFWPGTLSIISSTSVDNLNDIPVSYMLLQNYPNPFNPTTKIKFGLPEKAMIKLTIYDILGREIEKLVDKEMLPGSYEANWNAQNFSSGIYFYRIQAGDFSQTKKMLLLK